MENPSEDEENPAGGEENPNPNLWNASAIMNDDFIDEAEGTDAVSRVVAILNRHAPPRMAELAEDERLAELRLLVTKHMKTDEEKEDDRICEVSLLKFNPLLDRFSLTPDQLFLESFCDAWKEASSKEDLLNRIAVDETVQGIYKFRMMRRNACRMISQEIGRFSKWCRENGCSRSPSPVYENSTVLNYIGFKAVIGELLKYLKPIIEGCFGFDGEIDSHISFSVVFGPDGQHIGIDPIYGDPCDITIKLCLYDPDSTGAQLLLGGQRCLLHQTDQTDDEDVPEEVNVVMGEVIMHSGLHRNGFTPIQTYSKEYLIIWCKSPVFAEMRRLKIPKWCMICERLRKERQKEELEQLRSQVENALSFVRGSPSGEGPTKKPRMS